MHEFVEEGLGGCGEMFDPWGTGGLGVGDAAIDVGDGGVGVEEDGAAADEVDRGGREVAGFVGRHVRDIVVAEFVADYVPGGVFFDADD